MHKRDNHPPIFRESTKEDLNGIVSLHVNAFPNNFLTHLGSPFLWRYYSLLMNKKCAHLYVIEQNYDVVGFVGGYESSKHFCLVLLQNSYKFLMPLAWSICSRPVLIFRIMKRLKDVINGRSADFHGVTKFRYWELATIAVRSLDRGKGYGRTLVLGFLDIARKNSASGVMLVTEADGNDNANNFYTDLGFRLVETTDSARRMNKYVFVV